MISIVACCHGAQLCTHAARDFRSQHNLFSVAVHEIGHCIGLFHNTEDKDSVMQPIYKPGSIVENKNKILSESHIKTVQEMYGAAKHVIVMAIFNSNKAKVMINS